MSKNPFMSAWLSEYNKMTNAARGQMSAEFSRQQQALMKEWQDQWMEAWTAMWFPWLGKGTKFGSRRK